MIRIQFLKTATLLTLSLALCACSGGFRSTTPEANDLSKITNSPPITLPVTHSSSNSNTSPSVPAPSPQPTSYPAPRPPAITQALLLANPNLTVQAGQTLTVTTQFNAAPMDKDYTVFIHFIDPSGNQQSSINGDYQPPVSTRQWSGLVQYTRPIAIPASLPIGKYTIKVGLYENVPPYNNRPSLALSPGVTVDNQIRYIVGSVTITAPPQPKDSTPQPGGMSTLTPSGPITLESNQTYSGLRITNPNGPCVYGNQVSNVRITNSEIGPCGNGTNSEQVGIVVHSSTNIRIDHNVVHDVASGIAAVSSTGVMVDHNHISNIRGPFPSGHIVLFDKLYGAGNKMLCNVGDNTENDGTEDNVNTWMSHGVPDSPIEIAYNRIRGGHSKSGTGINIGDGGSDYVDVHDNTIVNVNNAGIGVSSGNFLKIRNNKVYNNGPYSSVGISVRNWYDGCSNIEVSGNRVWAFDHVWGMNSVWNYLNTGECSNVTESGNAFGDTSLSVEIFNQPYPECESN